jgi:phenylpyruvate tautomerase PptA (4-oxalocrotonate tautomerase family)
MQAGGFMPFVRIALLEGKPPDYRRAIADGLHSALVDTFEIPLQDRFRVIEEWASECLIYSHEYAEILSPGRLQPSAKLSLLDDQQEMPDLFVSSEAERHHLGSKGTSQ